MNDLEGVLDLFPLCRRICLVLCDGIFRKGGYRMIDPRRVDRMDIHAEARMNILQPRKLNFCKNCGHALVLVDGKLHHAYEFISWSEARSKRRLRCDSYAPDGRTSCNCEYPEISDEAGFKKRIIAEMMAGSEESE